MPKYNLDKKGIDIKLLADKTLTDEKLLKELMDGILSKDNTIRQNSFKTLELISKENPQFLYPHWNYFAEMLHSKNNFHKYIAIYLLANLTAVDEDNSFEHLFENYYGILGGERAMTASHVALNSSKIALNKPELREKIVDRLMNIEKIHQGKQKEMIKANAIYSLEKMYPEIGDKERVKDFVKAQLGSSSPKTRKAAIAFLDKYEYMFLL